MEVRVAEVVAVIERDKMVRNQDLIRLVSCGVPALNLWSESGHDWECFCKLIKEKVMREVIEEIVEVLKRHDINADLDSAQIEWDGVNFVFRCKDLAREAWERRMLMEAIDRIRTF